MQDVQAVQQEAQSCHGACQVVGSGMLRRPSTAMWSNWRAVWQAFSEASWAGHAALVPRSLARWRLVWRYGLVH